MKIRCSDQVWQSNSHILQLHRQIEVKARSKFLQPAAQNTSTVDFTVSMMLQKSLQKQIVIYMIPLLWIRSVKI